MAAAATAARQRPKTSVDKKTFPIPDRVPPGNWLAHQIRLLQDDSDGLFPHSPVGSKRGEKFKSVTRLDFCGPRDWEEYCPGFNVMPFERKRETLREILLKPNYNQQLFTNWRVPQRFYKAGAAVTEATPIVNEALEAAADEAEALRSVIEDASPVPSAARSQQKVQSPQRISRQMSLPDLKMRNSGKTRALGLTRQYTRLPDMSKVPSSPQPLISNAVPTVPQPKLSPKEEELKLAKEDLQQSLQPHVVAKAEQLMKLAPKADKRVIEKVLRIAEKKHLIDSSLKRTILPDARESVEKWLMSASEEERKVAVNFFNSLSGSKLMGQTATEQKKRLQQVIDTLEKNGKGNIPNGVVGKTDVAGRLRHLRLNSPNSRKNRWMHTTWHHLPEYSDKNIGNWSSHYIRPQAAIPRHFVIHPDWG